MKFKIKNNCLHPTDKNNDYGLKFSPAVKTHKDDGKYQTEAECKYNGTTPVGNPCNTKEDAERSLLAWLENAVDVNSSSTDWSV